MQWVAGRMLTERERAERSVQEKAQGLVARGHLEAAVRLLDGFLARFDGDWGIWLYFGHLCARLGWAQQSVAAFRASSRQLEADGFLDRARNALLEAVKVDPRDASLARDVQRLTRLLPQDPSQLTCVLPAVSPDEAWSAASAAGGAGVDSHPRDVRRPAAADAGAGAGGAVRSPSGAADPRVGDDRLHAAAVAGQSPVGAGRSSSGVPSARRSDGRRDSASVSGRGPAGAARPSPRAARDVGARSPSDRPESAPVPPLPPTVLARRSPPVVRALSAAPAPSVVVDETCLFDPVREGQPPPRPSPSLDLTPRRGPDPFSLLASAPIALRPARQSPPTAARQSPPTAARQSPPRAARVSPPDPRHQRTAVVARRREPAVTDPHLAIFDILDAEAASRREASGEL